MSIMLKIYWLIMLVCGVVGVANGFGSTVANSIADAWCVGVAIGLGFCHLVFDN